MNDGNGQVRLPKVTALLPCYNAAAFILPTLECLAQQTWPNLEILIADDCSTDGTAEIVGNFATGHANVRVLQRSRNLGWLDNSNDLMAQATGELMFFAFHDDVVAIDYVEKLAGALAGRPGAILAFSDLELYEIDGGRSEHAFEGLEGARTPFARGKVMYQRPRNWWVPNRGVFRATAFRQTGGIHKHAMGEFSADWTWLLHLALLGDFVRVPKVLCQKSYQVTSLSKSWPRGAEQNRALWRAGVSEIWGSKIGLPTKIALIVLITTRQERKYLARELRQFKARLSRR